MHKYKVACVVNVKYLGNLGTCCGILLDTSLGLVLAHGSCLSPFVEQGHLDINKSSFSFYSLPSFECDVLLQLADENEVAKEKAERLPHVEVSTSNHDAGKIQDIYRSSGSKTVHSVKRLNSHKEFNMYSKFSARITDFFQCQIVAESLNKLMPEESWELSDRRDTNDASKNNNNNKGSNSKQTAKTEQDLQRLISSFVIVKIENWVPYESQLCIQPARECHLGDKVEICSTPFGGLKPDAFINSHSRGIISNLAGKDNCLLLSDARCILGGEGAPLYTFKHEKSARYLTSVVIASLSWKNDEWVGFCIACDISAVIQNLPPHHLHIQRALQPNQVSSHLEDSALQQGLLSPEVVLVEVRSTWGSGVVIDQERGIILTCSHVVKEAHLHPVQVKRTGQRQKKPVEVLYRHHPLEHQFDMAVVKYQQCEQQHPVSAVSLSTAVPCEGMEVCIIGHSLFSSEHNLQPSVTSGVISKVIYIDKIPVMIQTTCAVHPGASGGALVDSKGCLVGIVVCNARDTTTGASFPHINMSIPVYTVWPVIDRFIKSDCRDVRCLELLMVKNKLLDKIWSLEATQGMGVLSVNSKL